MLRPGGWSLVLTLSLTWGQSGNGSRSTWPPFPWGCPPCNEPLQVPWGPCAHVLQKPLPLKERVHLYLTL